MKDGDSNEGGRVGDGRREATGERALTTMPGEESQGSVQTPIARKKNEANDIERCGWQKLYGDSNPRNSGLLEILCVTPTLRALARE